MTLTNDQIETRLGELADEIKGLHEAHCAGYHELAERIEGLADEIQAVGRRGQLHRSMIADEQQYSHESHERISDRIEALEAHAGHLGRVINAAVERIGPLEELLKGAIVGSSTLPTEPDADPFAPGKWVLDRDGVPQQITKANSAWIWLDGIGKARVEYTPLDGTPGTCELVPYWDTVKYRNFEWLVIGYHTVRPDCSATVWIFHKRDDWDWDRAEVTRDDLRLTKRESPDA